MIRGRGGCSGGAGALRPIVVGARALRQLDPAQMLVECADTGQVEIVMWTIEGDQEVLVCGHDELVRQGGACSEPRESDADCTFLDGAATVCEGA